MSSVEVLFSFIPLKLYLKDEVMHCATSTRKCRETKHNNPFCFEFKLGLISANHAFKICLKNVDKYRNTVFM
jgi:hypothetical protein